MATIRRAAHEDLATIIRFSREMMQTVFGRTIVVNEERLAAGVREVLDNPALRSWYYIAEESGRPVGQAMVTVEWDDWSARDIWFARRLYVVPEFRRNGVAAALLSRILEDAQATGTAGFLRANVHDENKASLAVIDQLGWTSIGQRVYVRDVSHANGAH